MRNDAPQYKLYKDVILNNNSNRRINKDSKVGFSI